MYDKKSKNKVISFYKSADTFTVNAKCTLKVNLNKISLKPQFCFREFKVTRTG